MIDEDSEISRFRKPRYAAFKILGECPHCKAGLPLNGPQRRIRCDNCLLDVEIGSGDWTMMLEDADEDHDAGEGGCTIRSSTEVRWKAEMPRCVECGEEIGAEGIEPGTDGTVSCPSCEHPNATHPAPDWLREALPTTVQLYGAERDEVAGEEPIARGARASKPVILSCPRCNGSLSVDSKSSRTVTCEYCHADVFLPDALWKSLHPVRVATWWWVRFEGTPPAIEEQLRRDAAEAEADRAEEVVVKRERRRWRVSDFVWVLVLAACFNVLMTLVFELSAEKFGEGDDPLFGRVGALLCEGACDGCTPPVHARIWDEMPQFRCEGPGGGEENLHAIAGWKVGLVVYVHVLPLTLVLAFLVALFFKYTGLGASDGTPG